MQSLSKKQLLDSLQFYEGIYHQKTLDRLERIVRGKEKYCTRNRAIKDYTKNNQAVLRASLENKVYGGTEQLNQVKVSKNHISLLWELYYLGSQPRSVLPLHLQNLLKHPLDLTTHWPYERDHDIVFGEKAHDLRTSLRYLWKESKKKSDLIEEAINNFQSQKWLLQKHPGNVKHTNYQDDFLDNETVDYNPDTSNEHSNTLLSFLKESVQQERQQLIFPVHEELNEDIRNNTIKDVMRHYLFLKNHPNIFQLFAAGAYYATPIVNIPMTILGHDVGIKRMRNIFYRKVALMRSTLIEEMPPLCDPLHDELQSIIADENLDKKTRQLYKKVACKSGTYTADGKLGSSSFALSSLMLDL
ncbi:hypothetical protein ACO0RG_002507 [Hanseniaspora osmophila]|uniref:Genetic interactor of prohibitin 5, mitochondrial n=1 Tax=Hanseniaspora osmophila TaxID=56408 RepID=A0A1E5RVN1_9ASCO|nr:Genetic interactor of prohibitin 5, mitochondrial [Hanseniaspora osmophila]